MLQPCRTPVHRPNRLRTLFKREAVTKPLYQRGVGLVFVTGLLLVLGASLAVGRISRRSVECPVPPARYLFRHGGRKTSIVGVRGVARHSPRFLALS